MTITFLYLEVADLIEEDYIRLNELYNSKYRSQMYVVLVITVYDAQGRTT